MKYIVIYSVKDPVFGSCENYIECENATQRNNNIKELKFSDDIIEISFCKFYADGEPGTIKTVFKK
ncbi:MAG: hypothetical protein J6S67_09480 [Methanobrevibacter sp.]|nr:hypothetical protein [Methanobrevibacter sp.]